jgi:hypothetical protein
MSSINDLVRTSIDYAERNFNVEASTIWYVSFITNEIRHGTITDIGGGNYLLMGGKNYFFNASQVAYLHPSV